jgi:hypothetical protein
VTARYAQNLLTLGLDPTLKECITLDHRSSAEPLVRLGLITELR